MADNNTIARPYAHAIFELAHAAGDLADWSASLDVAGQLLRRTRLVEYLGNPQFNDEQRLEFLTGLFAKADAKLLAARTARHNFLKLLLENGRIACMPEIARTSKR